MSAAIRLLRLGTVPGWMSQAVYHALAETMHSDRPDTIVVCTPNNPYLCLGYFQHSGDVFDKTALQKAGIPVYKRRIGGGATYLDKDQLFYQFIFNNRHVPVSPEKSYRHFLQVPLETLQHFGLESRLRAVNELEVNGRRIAGIGGGRIGEASVVVGNFLFDFDYETMSRVWRAPCPGYREIAREALRQRVYTLKDCAPQLQPDEVEAELIRRFSAHFNQPVVEGTLTPEESQAIVRWRHKLTDLSETECETSIHRPRPLKIAAGVFVHHGACVLPGRKERYVSVLEQDGRIARIMAQDGLPRRLKEMENHPVPQAWAALEALLVQSGIQVESKTWPQN
ncbi:MAG: lipoate--protein ligase family protein [Calditrichaeota bacterium]|nr:MAG: lipoate--protein ligase family protein [Calditrichota bacterium]